MEPDADRVAVAPPGTPAEGIPPRPSAKAAWIGGYWGHDGEAGRYVWVPGTWRVPPPGRTWVDGYWARDPGGYVRIPGYWTDNPAAPYRSIGPPASPAEEARGPRPSPLHRWVPPYYEPRGEEFVLVRGFWSKHQRGWTWVPTIWLKRPQGWVYQEGFWVKDADLLAARREATRGVVGARTAPAATGDLLTDAEALLRAWGRERPRAPRGTTAEAERARLAAERTAILNALSPAPSSVLPSWPDPTTGAASGGGRQWPSPAYYVGNSLPGTTYPSFSSTPSAIPGQSTYIGNALPGTAYPSYSPTQTGLPGSSYYIGNSLPGTSYPSFSTGVVNSIGNYGYGTGAPGNTAGQLGNVNP